MFLFLLPNNFHCSFLNLNLINSILVRYFKKNYGNNAFAEEVLRLKIISFLLQFMALVIAAKSHSCHFLIYVILKSPVNTLSNFNFMPFSIISSCIFSHSLDLLFLIGCIIFLHIKSMLILVIPNFISMFVIWNRIVLWFYKWDISSTIHYKMFQNHSS